jgi:hypothetical protein
MTDVDGAVDFCKATMMFGDGVILRISVYPVW